MIEWHPIVVQPRYLGLHYLKEMGRLMKENNGLLTFNPITGVLARTKILNIVHQLNSQRNVRIIRFLYELVNLLSIENILH